MYINVQSFQINKFSDLIEIQPTLKQQCPDTRISFISKTRLQIAQEAENLGAIFRGGMISAGTLGIVAVSIKVATLVGTFSLAALPVAWGIAIVAMTIAAIAIGILIYRHITSKQNGYNPKTFREFCIGLAFGSLAGTATALIIATCKFIGATTLALAPKPGNLCDYSAWTILGYSKTPQKPETINLGKIDPQFIEEDADDRFRDESNVIRIFKGDKIEIRTPGQIINKEEIAKTESDTRVQK